MRAKLRISLAILTAVGLAIGVATTSSATNRSSPSKSATIPVFRMGTAQSFPTLDQTKNIAIGGSLNVLPLGLEGLTCIGTNGRVQDVLAKSVSHPNATTYVYHLRHGVKFWDGAAMTAGDVVYALNYYRRPS